MAIVPLTPVGAPTAALLDTQTFADNRDAAWEREATLRERRAEIAAGWGPKYLDRVHKKGKLSSRERIARLVDPGTDVFEVGTFVNYDRLYQGKLRSPAAGVITAFARSKGAGA